MAEIFTLPAVGDTISPALRPKGLIARAAGPQPHRRVAELTEAIRG